jgi:uncharacterized protein (TIGR00304 family)
MNKYHILSFVCFILGFAFFAIGFLTGEAEGGIIIVFPFIAGSGLYPLIGFIFIFVAILLFMFGFTTHFVRSDETQDDYQPSKKTSVKGGGVVLIGPIPIVFGSNWKIAILLMLLVIILIILSIFTFKL